MQTFLNFVLSAILTADLDLIDISYNCCSRGCVVFLDQSHISKVKGKVCICCHTVIYPIQLIQILVQI